MFARSLYSFTGEFETIAVDEGTQLTHRYDVRFRQPLTALFGSAVERWLDADLEEEMARIAATLGVPDRTPPRPDVCRGPDVVIFARAPQASGTMTAVLAVAFGFASGGLVLLMMVAGTKDATNTRPPGGPPGVGYTRAAAETRYQRRRVAIVGVTCLGIALVLVAASAVTG